MVPRWGSLITYVVCVGLLVFMLMFLCERLSFYIVILPLIIGTVTPPLFIGWSGQARYPFFEYRRKSVILWGYGSILTLLVTTAGVCARFQWWESLLAYFVSFVFLTTLTFGDLPGIGGAWRTFNELDRRSRMMKKHPRDSVYISVGEVCSRCLTAVSPDDWWCWRCGNTLRADLQFNIDWRSQAARWKREKEDGQTVWVKAWLPRYSYEDERGVIHPLMGVDMIGAKVRDDGSWRISATVSSHPYRKPCPVIIEEGEEKTVRKAKKEVDRVILALPPGFVRELVEEHRERGDATQEA